MTCMKKILPPLLLMALLLSACSAEEPSSATPMVDPMLTATNIPEPTPSATMPPVVGFPALNLLPGSQPGDWRVVGLIENSSGMTLIDAYVLVTLLDASASSLSSVEVPITFMHLGPNEISPFRADFPGAGLATDARAVLPSYSTGEFQRRELQVEVVSASSVDRGGTAILAAVSNTGDTAASIAALAVLAQDGRGRAVGLANMVAGPRVVRSGETIAALAHLEIDAGSTRFIPYVDAISANLMPEPDLVAVENSIKLVFDDQGNPIVVGALRNSSQEFHHGSVIIVLSIEQQGISMAQVDTTIPLGPGEIRPFTAVEFPGLTARLEEVGGSLQNIEVAVRSAPLTVGSEAEAYSPLDLSIQSFERIGGSAFVLGTVSNPYANPVQDTTVMATLYGSSGRIVSAAWYTVTEILLPGETHDFVLPIPMPANTNPRLSEFDIWAAGIQTAPSPNQTD
jgi:hypothetical protein